MSSSHTPVALTIAGSDSGGGAGIQADLRTFQRFGVHGATAITAVTAQNTLEVERVHLVPSDVVAAQIDAVVRDLRPAALKSGMLGTAEVVDVVADAIVRHGLRSYVLDPVAISTSGTRLLDAEGERLLAERLLPLAALVTPNLAEAAELSGVAVTDPESMLEAARRIVERGAVAALVTGGHLPGAEVVDVLWDGRDALMLKGVRLPGRGTHGTGCTLSAAVAAGLAHGRPLERAVRDAVEHVRRAIASAPRLGGGNGPLGVG